MEQAEFFPGSVARVLSAAAMGAIVLTAAAAFAGDPPAGFPGRVNNVALDEFTVTVQGLELCASGSTVSNCVSAVTVASGTKAFNIAGADVGAEVGSYGAIGALPIGTTFTHIRVTLSPEFTMKSPAAGVTGDDNAGADSGTCFTLAINDNTNAATIGGGDAIGPSAAQIMTVPFASDDPDTVGPGPTLAVFSALNVQRLAATPTEMLFIIQLSAPFTAGIDAPLISMEFATVGAMAALNNGGGVCQFFYPLPPTVTITLTTP